MLNKLDAEKLIEFKEMEKLKLENRYYIDMCIFEALNLHKVCNK